VKGSFLAEKSVICVVHEDREATLTCERCGNFICDGCVKMILARKVCLGCTNVNGVDYLESYRLSVWGKRDEYVWFIGGLGSFGTILLLGVLFISVSSGPGGLTTPFLLTAIPMAISLGISVAYLCLQRWARIGLFLGPVLNIWIPFFAAGSSDPEVLGAVIVMFLFPFLFYLAALTSARNKLAFKIEVSEAKLEQLYKTYGDNQIARYSLPIGVFGLFLCVPLVMSLLFSVVGLKRVDPKAWPPVGGRGIGIAGLVVSILGILFWSGIFLLSVMGIL
jgi:hypothetical protein